MAVGQRRAADRLAIIGADLLVAWPDPDGKYLRNAPTHVSELGVHPKLTGDVQAIIDSNNKAEWGE